MRTAPVLRLPMLPILSALSVLSALGCGSEPHEGAEIHSQPGLAPRASPDPGLDPAPILPAPLADADAETEAEAGAGPSVDPSPEPELDQRKLALANVGRGAFEALQTGKFAALLELTPIHEGPLRDACSSMATADRHELEARFDHCHEVILWDAVAEAQVFAGQPSGAPARGCEAGIEDYGRLQLFLHMADKTIWRVDFYGAVGRDGNAVGINGEVSCQKVDEAPPLK